MYLFSPDRKVVIGRLSAHPWPVWQSALQAEQKRRLHWGHCTGCAACMSSSFSWHTAWHEEDGHQVRQGSKSTSARRMHMMHSVSIVCCRLCTDLHLCIFADAFIQSDSAFIHPYSIFSVYALHGDRSHDICIPNVMLYRLNYWNIHVCICDNKTHHAQTGVSCNAAWPHQPPYIQSTDERRCIGDRRRKKRNTSKYVLSTIASCLSQNKFSVCVFCLYCKWVYLIFQ